MMPRQVDHEVRRRAIADALVRVAAANGLESVSLRHVATEAGVSVGMVQHYFRTKDEMMAFAMRIISEAIESRMTSTVNRLSDAPSPIALCRALLIELLPIDERRRSEGRVALAFLAYCAVNPDLAAAHAERDGTDRLRSFVEELIRSDPTLHNGDQTLDPRAAATALLALVDGLSLQVLGGQYTSDTALHAFEAGATAMLGVRP